jgi:hypothetical protein
MFVNTNNIYMKFLILSATLIILYACNNTPSEETRKDGFTPVLKSKEDSLYHEVMQGHDVGMAKMAKLKKQLVQVQRELDSIKKLNPGRIDLKYQQALLGLQEELSYADHAMFKWMEEFKVDSAKDDKEKRLAYLESEKLKVEKVRNSILISLQRADSLLKK